MLFASAFLLGLASSFHCIGMCGPIAMALPLNRRSKWTILGGLLLNNFGRICTYSLIGLVFGTIGFSLNLYRFFQYASIIVGLAMIVLAWKKQWIKKIEFSNSFLQKWVVGNMGKLLAAKSPLKLMALGMLNGLLPCGIIFMAISTALLATNAVGSSATMIAFGLGTFPGMLMVGYFAHQFSTSLRQQLTKGFPYIMTIVGVLVILRGANLGIPYLSPKVEITKQSAHVAGKKPQTFQVICHGPSKKK